ncbi:MAG: DUF4160 domain-containing protein [Thermodesulfobacteriota bacterium]
MPFKRSIDGITIYMYERESHGPPHVHVWCDKQNRGLIAIEELEVISAHKLPPSCLKLVREWIAQHKEELMTFWRDARERQRQGGIRP